MLKNIIDIYIFFSTRFVSDALSCSELVADLTLSGVSKVPVLVALALVPFAYFTCGTLALLLACCFHFVILFDMYKDHVKKVLLKMIPGKP